MIRALAYHEGGFWLMTKRLSRGRFQGWPTTSGEPMSPSSAEALRALLAGSAWIEVDAEALRTATSRLSDQTLARASSRAPTCATV